MRLLAVPAFSLLALFSTLGLPLASPAANGGNSIKELPEDFWSLRPEQAALRWISVHLQPPDRSGFISRTTAARAVPASGRATFRAVRPPGGYQAVPIETIRFAVEWTPTRARWVPEKGSERSKWIARERLVHLLRVTESILTAERVSAAKQWGLGRVYVGGGPPVGRFSASAVPAGSWSLEAQANLKPLDPDHSLYSWWQGNPDELKLALIFALWEKARAGLEASD